MARRREAMTESFRVRVTATMREQVERIAGEQEVDVSDVVRDALGAHVAACEVERSKAARRKRAAR